MIGFRNWFEATDRSDILRLWKSLKPTADINIRGIKSFTRSMSDPETSAMMVDLMVKGRPVIHIMYDKPIVGNLVTIEDPNLGKATGLIDSTQNPVFYFYMTGDEAGDMLIRFPPVIFGRYDVLMLESIITHESIHAHDWSKGLSEEYPVGPKYHFNMELYAKNMYEVRAMLGQLKLLLSQLGETQSVIDALNQSGRTFALNRELKEIAIEFITKYGSGMHEEFTPFDANLLSKSQFSLQRKEEVKKIVELLGKSLNLMLFSKYISI